MVEALPQKNVELPKKYDFQLLFSVYTIQECILRILCVFTYELLNKCNSINK